LSIDLPIRQVAYFTTDVRRAARRHRALFGSGPYLVAEHIPLRLSRHRGVDRPLDHTSAYGQWGPVMIEFVQQNNPGPSCFHDMYPEGSGRSGIHHLALWVEDIHAEIARYAGEGHEAALYAELNDGFAFAMIDVVADHGHMIELYQPAASLRDFYAMVASIADPSSDVEAIREISLG
jgi:catechol 2,3-dioxygenase-like lactoylglutathione lyase family enzyme